MWTTALGKLGKLRLDQAKTNSKERMDPASWDSQRGSNQSVGGYEVLPFLMSSQKDRTSQERAHVESTNP